MPVLEKNSGHTCRWLGCSISINSSSLQMTALDRPVQSLSKHSGEAAMPLQIYSACSAVSFPQEFTFTFQSEPRLLHRSLNQRICSPHLNHMCAILRNETLLHAFKEVNQLQIVPDGLKKLENAPTNGPKVKIQSVVLEEWCVTVELFQHGLPDAVQRLSTGFGFPTVHIVNMNVATGIWEAVHKLFDKLQFAKKMSFAFYFLPQTQ